MYHDHGIPVLSEESPRTIPASMPEFSEAVPAPSEESSEVIPALSEKYSDIILKDPALPFPDNTRVQPVDSQYTILYAPLSNRLSTVEEIGYSSVPKLFTEINAVSLEASGILPVRIQAFLELSGAGVLLGFLDSGIDYTHPAFRNPDGTTRILRLWDQADVRGIPPAGISYGTEYKKEQINDVLFSKDTAQRIPERDPSGHGTAVAGIACGSPDIGEGFTGAAPESAIAFVRLKPAKRYLRDYFRIPEGATAYQENDLMLGVRYLQDCAAQLGLPLVICLSLGTSQGGHTGDTPLEEILNTALLTPGVCAVTGTGNEAGRDHHVSGHPRYSGDSTDVELLVDQKTQGFTIEFWSDAPELYSMGFVSPLGETIQPVRPENNSTREFSFLLEKSRISITWSDTGQPDRSQVTLLRFADPTPGVWRIRVVSLSFDTGAFHMWLPISGLIEPDIRFYAADADTTLIIPSCSSSSISVSAWNAYSSSLYAHSGRGYTRNGQIRPDFASPGVQVTAPAAGGTYSSITGSSAAAALASGAAALLLSAGLKQNPPRLFTVQDLKRLFLGGVQQFGSYSYPNRLWGYGAMNLYGIFLSQLSRQNI